MQLVKKHLGISKPCLTAKKEQRVSRHLNKLFPNHASSSTTQFGFLLRGLGNFNMKAKVQTGRFLWWGQLNPSIYTCNSPWQWEAWAMIWGHCEDHFLIRKIGPWLDGNLYFETVNKTDDAQDTPDAMLSDVKHTMLAREGAFTQTGFWNQVLGRLIGHFTDSPLVKIPSLDD